MPTDATLSYPTKIGHRYSPSGRNLLEQNKL